MSNPETAQRGSQPASVFAALGDSTRLELVARLSAGKEYSIAQLSTGLTLSRQGVTKHLQVLEDAGIVVSNRTGRENRFSYVPAAVAPAQSYLREISAQWELALGRLRTYVESQSGAEPKQK